MFMCNWKQGRPGNKTTATRWPLCDQLGLNLPTATWVFLSLRERGCSPVFVPAHTLTHTVMHMCSIHVYTCTHVYILWSATCMILQLCSGWGNIASSPGSPLAMILTFDSLKIAIFNESKVEITLNGRAWGRG